jgi:hypothetical protein
MAVEASLYRLRRHRLLLIWPAVILAAILALEFTPISNWYYLDSAFALLALAWFVTAWVMLRRMRRWQCPSCGKPFFRDQRVRVPTYFQRYNSFRKARCENCGTPLSS